MKPATPKKRTSSAKKSPAAMAAPSPSKDIVVAAAIAAQLHHEGRWPPNNLTKQMASEYHYIQQTLNNFLIAVAWNLAHGQPPLTFTFNQAFVTGALQMSVAQLMAAVDGQTT